MTPRGDIDGLILADGTEVKTPPHLSTEMAYAIRLGDTVVVHGLRAAALPLIQAVSVTDEATGRTVIDRGPPGPGRRPPPPPAREIGLNGPPAGSSEVQGRVRMELHGPRGEVNGALLDDGTMLRLPPAEADRFAGLLQPGQAIVAEGRLRASALGRVVEVRELGPTRTELSLIDGGPPPRRRPPRPDGPDRP